MIRIVIALLALATAAVHFSFFTKDPAAEAIYGLNALGYLGLLALLYLPLPPLQSLRPAVRWIFIGYTALTIAAYVGFGLVVGEWTVPLGPVTKLIEVILIGLLWWDGRLSSTQTA